MPEIVRSTDGNIIGSIDNGVFTKRVQSDAHMLHTPRAWAIDCQAFLTEVALKSHTIRVEALDTGIIYEVSTKVFNAKKGYLNRGFGPQYFLPLKFWHEIRLGQKALPLAP